MDGTTGPRSKRKDNRWQNNLLVRQCNKSEGKWVTTHNTSTHVNRFQQKKKEENETSNSELGKSQPSKKLKLSNEMKAAMKTLTSFNVQEADLNSDSDFGLGEWLSEPSYIVYPSSCIQ